MSSQALNGKPQHELRAEMRAGDLAQQHRLDGASLVSHGRVELRHLRYFVAVAEELHFGRAAARLHIVQSALSRQVASLEMELGVRLLERTKRRVRLTEAGRVFLEESRSVLTMTQGAADAARRTARGQIGKLGIGFVGPVTYSVLPGLLRVYREHYPDAELDLHEWTTSEQCERLRDGSIQVGFVHAPVEEDDLVFETVLREPVMVVLPEDHPLASCEKVPLEHLADDPFILAPSRREPGMHDRCTELCRAAGFSPTVVQEANRVHTVVGLVASGIGVSLAPASTRALERPGVVYRRLPDPSPTLETSVARRREEPSPVLRAFLEIVADAGARTVGA